MKGSNLNRWQSLTAERSVRWLKYSFGPGTANSLAIKLKAGGWMVISPPADVPPPVYDALEQDGGVCALVAPNAYHNAGQAAWRQRFSAALSWAPAASRARLAKKTPAVHYLPIEEALHQFAPADVFLPDGMKAPDMLFRVRTEDGFVWWMGDQFSNSQASDQTWPLRMLARFLGGGLGYRCNSKPELVYVRDRSAWLDSIRRALQESPPAIVVPAHGDPVTLDAARRTRKVLDDVAK